MGERERLQRKGRKGVGNQLTRTLYTLLFIQKKNNVVITVTHTHTHMNTYTCMHMCTHIMYMPIHNTQQYTYTHPDQSYTYTAYYSTTNMVDAISQLTTIRFKLQRDNSSGSLCNTVHDARSIQQYNTI